MSRKLGPLPPMPSYADRVFTVLREAIVSLELEPGQEISETMVANSLQVSRSPVRQALKLLQGAGLVVSFPQRGTFVTHINVKEVHDACEMRLLIENWTLQRLESTGLGDQEELIAGLLDEQEKACARREYSTFLDLESAFHEALITATGNLKARELFHQVNVSILRVRSWGLKHLKVLDDSIREHRALVEAIKRSDWTEARRLVLEAVKLEESLRQMRSAFPDYFI